MILADENLPSSICFALRNGGITVYSIAEEQPGLSDEEIVGLSLNPKRIVLTEDKGFGEWVFRYRKKTGVILLRYHYHDKEKITRIVVDLVKSKGENLFNKFVTITLDKVRIREI